MKHNNTMSSNRPVRLRLLRGFDLQNHRINSVRFRTTTKTTIPTVLKEGMLGLVNVSYPDHYKVFKERIWEMFSNKHKVDLDIGGVRAHRFILELFIPQLAKLLEMTTNSDGNAGDFDTGLNVDDLMLLIEFVYRGTLVDVNSQQLKSLRNLTNKLNVPLKVENSASKVGEDEILTTTTSPMYIVGRLRNVRRMVLEAPTMKKNRGQLDNTKVTAPLTSRYFIRPRISGAPVNKQHRCQPENAKMATLLTRREVIRPQEPEKKLSKDLTATSGEWINVDQALNDVPKGATVILRGNREIRRHRLSARRRLEAMAALTNELDDSVRSIVTNQSASVEPTGMTGIDDGICNTSINPDDTVASTSAGTATEVGDASKVGLATHLVTGSGDNEEGGSSSLELRKCSKCHFETHCQRRYISHLKNKHDPSRVLLKCTKCDRHLATRAGMERHLLTHKDDQQTYECKHCDYTTPKKWNFHLHMSGRHNRTVNDELIPAKFHCDVCSYGCATKSQLISHVFREHSAAAAPFKCPHCSYGSISYSNLEKHVNSVHLNYRPMICHTCGRGFSNQFSLKVHVRIHTNERPHRCSIPGCNKAFAALSGLKRHRLSHGNLKPFVCDHCGYACKLRYNLRAHLKRHENVDEVSAS